MKVKHLSLLNHFLGFVDPFTYPDFILTEEIGISFITFQSFGKSRLTEEEYQSIIPLIHAQEIKEITI